jgi:Lon protease-like protein
MKGSILLAAGFFLLRVRMPIEGFSSWTLAVKQPRLRRTSVRAHLPLSKQSHKCGQVEDQDERFLLPIFPLRKSPRLPTESITLNLYEDRYLAMSEFVLRHCAGRKAPDLVTWDGNAIKRLSVPALIAARFETKDCSPFFGAMYCRDKPHIARGDLSRPIVPVVSAGDVGVVFAVQQADEGMIPTAGGETRRRIRLYATAVYRFSIDEILHDGYSDGSLPYILVLASGYWDNEDSQTVLEGDRSYLCDWCSPPLATDRKVTDTQLRETLSFKMAAEALVPLEARRRLQVLRLRSTSERVFLLRDHAKETR